MRSCVDPFTKNKMSKIYSIAKYIFRVFYVSLKPGLTQWERNIGWVFWRMGFWGRYFGPQKRDGEKQTGENFHYVWLHDLYSSPNNIRVIKLKTITWAVHVACMGEKRNTCRVFVEKPEGNGPLVMPGEERRITLK
jgi:hypothetical protein